MIRKLRKLRRYWAANLRPASDVPVFWHVGRPNFGDDLNPGLFELIGGRRARFSRNRNEHHFLGMGSILERSVPASIILGSGFLLPPKPGQMVPGEVIAVRGELSRRAVSTRDVLLGDPMVLLNLLMPFAKTPDGTTGFVPHVSQIGACRDLKLKRIKIIDPSLAPRRVLREIAACSKVYSQSLHGLIVADALSIPNAWVAPPPNLKGGRFKFDDYFSTLDAPKIPYPMQHSTFHGKSPEFSVGNFRHNKAELLEAFQFALAGGTS